MFPGSHIFVELDAFAKTISDDMTELTRKFLFKTKLELVTMRDGGMSMALGDMRWSLIDKYVSRLKDNRGHKLVLSVDQNILFRAYKRACLPHLYEEAVFDRYKEVILRKHNTDKTLPNHRWDKLEQNVLCVASRRVGKTYVLSLFLMCISLVCPCKKIVILSTGGRASDWMLDTILWFMSQLKETSRRITLRGEKLYIFDKPLESGTSIATAKMLLKASTTTTVTALPANPVKCRGVSADILAIDEAGHMSAEMFQVACIPLLLIKNTVMVAITTPGPEYDYFAEIMDIKNEAGESFARSFRFGRVCRECAKAGKALSCTHKKNKVREHWHSDERFEWVKRIQMRTSQEKFISETLGVYTRSENRLFDIEWIDSFRDRCTKHPFDIKSPVKLVTIGIDPAGGGKASRYAMVSVAHMGQHRVVRLIYILYMSHHISQCLVLSVISIPTHMFGGSFGRDEFWFTDAPAFIETEQRDVDHIV